MRRFFCFLFVFWCMLVIPAQTFGNPVPNDPLIGFVDVTRLLLNHPLMRNFDLDTKRFLDTPSAWVSDPAAAQQGYQAQIETLSKKMKELEAQIQKASPKKQGKSGDLERIWKSKAELKLRIDQLQKAIQASKIKGNYLLGAATGVESIIPIIKQISRDILNSIKEVSMENGNLPIIDMNAFVSSSPPEKCNRSILFKNFQTQIWDGSFQEVDRLRDWIHSVRLFIQEKEPRKFSTPFLTGFKDLRNESLKKMTFGTR